MSGRMKPWLASIKLCSPVWSVALVLPIVSVIVLVAGALWTELFVAGVDWPATLASAARFALGMLGIGLVLSLLLFFILVPVTRYEIWKNNNVEPEK